MSKNIVGFTEGIFIATGEITSSDVYTSFERLCKEKKISQFILSNGKTKIYSGCCKHYEVSIFNEDLILSALPQGVKSIFTFNEELYDFCASISLQLGLVYNKPSSLLNKEILYTKCYDKKYLPWKTFKNLDETINSLPEFIATWGCDCIVKPTSYSDSAGVTYISKLYSKSDIYNKLSVSTKDAKAKGYNINTNYIAMIYLGSFYDPIEICVDGFVDHGNLEYIVQMKEGTKSVEPYFDSKIVCSSNGVDSFTHNTLAENLTDLDFLQGVFHFEYRLHGNNFIILDAAGRPGGGFIPQAFMFHKGIDLRTVHVVMSISESCNIQLIPQRYRATIMRNFNITRNFFTFKSKINSLGKILCEIQNEEYSPSITFTDQARFSVVAGFESQREFNIAKNLL